MVEQGLKEIETGVDRLVDFLKGRGIVDLMDISNDLNIPINVLQKWIDFLVEEKIVGIDYKFTKPFVYLLEKETSQISGELTNYRKNFENTIKEKKLPQNKTEFLWKNHILNEVEKKKAFFFSQASVRNLSHPEKLWSEYKKQIGV